MVLEVHPSASKVAGFALTAVRVARQAGDLGDLWYVLNGRAVQSRLPTAQLGDMTTQGAE